MHGFPRPTHNLRGSFHSYHSHRSRKARANLSVSSTPRPPYSFGLQTTLPVDLAFGSRCLVRAGPKESSLNFGKAMERALRHDEGRDGEYCLGGNDRPNKCRTTDRSDVLALPSDQFAGRFVLKVLEIHLLQLPNREW